MRTQDEELAHINEMFGTIRDVMMEDHDHVDELIRESATTSSAIVWLVIALVFGMGFLTGALVL